MRSFKTIVPALMFSAALVASTSVMANPVTAGAGGGHSNISGVHGGGNTSGTHGGGNTSGTHGGGNTSGVTKPGKSN